MKPQLSRPGWELPVLDLISYGPTVTRNTTQHSISYTVSAFLWHYWNGLDELSMVLSVVGTQPDTGDPAPDHPRRYRLSWKVMVFHESALCPIRVMGWKKAGNHWSRNLHSRILLPRISSDCYPKPGGVGAGFFFFFSHLVWSTWMFPSKQVMYFSHNGREILFCTFSIQSQLPGICLSLKLSGELSIIFGKKRKVRKEGQ